WNKTHGGKFYRFYDEPRLEPRADRPGPKGPRPNDPKYWREGRLPFEPLVDLATFSAVQERLERERADKTRRAPLSAEWHFSGLLFCAGCTARMVAGPKRPGQHAYVCGTYIRYVNDGQTARSPCPRNAILAEGVDGLEHYLERFLDDTGRKLDVFARRL